MYVVFIVLTVIVSILLIGIVLIQKSKGGGLSSQFGNASSVMGVRQTNSFLEKTTWTLAALIGVLSVCSAYTLPKVSDGTTIRTESAAPAPAIPATGEFGTPAPAEAPAAAPAAETPAAPAAQAD
ncbi:MAG: preprotein translocase subunit SecG [Muribaculaceae bacterium]|nr:preprotein translocase subunit SecG [Muribaculaceae bacterium]